MADEDKDDDKKEEESTPSAREALEAAFDEAEGDDDEEAGDDEDSGSEDEDGEEEEDDDKESGDEESSDDDGDEEEGDGGEEGKGEEDEDEGDEDSDGDAEGDDGGDDEQSANAPASWDPASREHWKDVPKEVKATILKREKEVAETLGATTQARQIAGDWANLVHPYTPLMAAQGANPYQGVKRLLEIGAGLAQGNATHKADIIKNLIQQYQIDLPTLDSMLAGETPQGGSVDVQGEVQRALQEERQRAAQANQQQEQQTAASEIEVFSKDKKKAEFFEDVKLDMADLLDVAAQRGRTLSIEDAYQQACQLNPTVKQVLDQRAAAAASKKKKAAVNKKKKAASSVKGSPSGGDKGDSGEKTARSVIEAAWDNAERKRNRV